MRRCIPYLILVGATAFVSACADVSAPRRDDAADCAAQQRESGYIMPSGYVCE